MTDPGRQMPPTSPITPKLAKIIEKSPRRAATHNGRQTGLINFACTRRDWVPEYEIQRREM